MNDNLDSTSGQGPKKLTDITEADIIREAIACAKKHGWEVGPGVCQIRPVVPNADPVAEIGLGWSTITPPITEWDVHITPRVPPNPYSTPLRVHIEYNQGLVSDFYGPTLSGSEGGTSLDYRL